MRYSRLAVVTAAFLVAFGLPAASQNNTNSDTYDQLRLFGDVFEKVRADYVEEVTDQQLVENAGFTKVMDLLCYEGHDTDGPPPRLVENARRPS